MNNFDYKALPWNIVFGVDALQRLPEELGKLQFCRVLVLTTYGQRHRGKIITKLLGSKSVGLFDRAVMHVPIETVREAMETVESLRADCTVSLGGGSTTGLGKALALKLGIPNIAIPTTYAGSEMTNIWGITENGHKVTGRDDIVVPTLTLYDPKLTLDLPARVAGPSGLNAMAQAVVNLTSGALNPIVSNMALAAVHTLTHSLPVVVAEPDNIEARADALLGASLAGGSLGTGVTSLHHRLCHTFGGSFNTPHAETHTVLLPHCVAYNAAKTTGGIARLAQAMDVSEPARGLQQLARTLGAPTSLREIGIVERDLDKAADIATQTPVNNPESVSRDRVRKLLDNAFFGREPVAV
ncbi:maleylacetate reductase [Pseudomaricurvus alkylphenolicus]|uniref:maleylacetate reductase n=1 Tax=Pseudomaricurvus alkylphenolicus TaxID=1306991 RepID=UPI00141D833B|nr:maleylacetate reductase [Pseudomaricurvus alkylphenolicus]NIB38710.1 maleylacetate reductase [Pseudomaricurvus alkylphenolicus]